MKIVITLSLDSSGQTSRASLMKPTWMYWGSTISPTDSRERSILRAWNSRKKDIRDPGLSFPRGAVRFSVWLPKLHQRLSIDPVEAAEHQCGGAGQCVRGRPASAVPKSRLS